jgi:flagellar motility protein MotE (MotC chaperone)
MKFVLVPLLIVAMFFSFAAALIAMLFFTETVKKPEQLVQLWEGGDSTRLRDEFRPKGFSVDSFLTQSKEYNALYEEKLEQLQEREDSLAQVEVQLTDKGKELINKEAELKGLADSTRKEKQVENLADLTKLINGLKPAPAAEILQSDEGLTDTMQAMILKDLDPAKAGKIMAAMNTGHAAHLTRIIQEL